MNRSATHEANAGCYHCGLPVPADTHYAVRIGDVARPMCCRGCEAVAQAIVDSGLTDFYRYRTENAPTGRERIPDSLRQAQAYDHPEVQKSFVRIAEGDIREASLILEGITCAACVWLNEQHLRRLPGVLEVSVNYATHRARVKWDAGQLKLSQILEGIRAIGYLAHPYDPGRQERLIENERRSQLRRLGVAGVLGMQIMILAVALYAGDWYGMEQPFREFFSWLSLIVTLPVLLYSAQPFFRAAWRDLRHGQAGMDVPVALGIGIAFLGSAWATVTGTGHVYYDSVAMFVFFLLAARYVELIARKRAAEAGQALVHAAPAMATRLLPDGDETIPVAQLRPGDRVLVRPGETIPADGTVAEGRSSVDESLVTGESRPVARDRGAAVIGGSINIESPLQIAVARTGDDTVLAAILRLLDRAQTHKPRLSQLADRVASRFVPGVLLLASAVALYWWQHDPARWLPITVAVLVVTCPCALSLATPAAMTAATGNLTRLGLLVTRGHVLETLARATHFVFDKTGTLTEGRLRLVTTRTFNNTDTADALRTAAALEAHSEHPIARAITDAAAGGIARASDVSSTPGGGMAGEIDGTRYLLGSAGFVVAGAGLDPASLRMPHNDADGATVVWLARDGALLAVFALSDVVRAGAREAVDGLKRAGQTVALLTGDHAPAARRLAAELDIEEIGWELTPQDKLDYVEALQRDGAIVVMVGDGVNDAPVLAAAHVSVAMGGGTQIAAATADSILLSQQLPHLVQAVDIARRTLTVVRQNLSWAVLYNAVALPLAAIGWIAPWMAAIGMSASSLVVVANALRLTRGR